MVVEGQYIGDSGGKRGEENSGSSTGPHLHFEIRKSPYSAGTDINPTAFFSDKLTNRSKTRTYNAGDESMPNIQDPPIDSGVDDSSVEIETEDLENNSSTPDISESDAIESENIEDVGESKDRLASGIWQITKLLVDESVANLRLYDVATSVQIGSLASFFHKVCQKPLVEFMGDTYGDQYYFIARKPPFDKEGMLDVLIKQGLFDESGQRVNSKNNYFISQEEVLNTNLSFNTRDIYSWYQFYPIYEMGMSTNDNYNFIIPAVYFPEYATIYGSREFSIRSQYRKFHEFVKDELNENNESSQGNHETMNMIHDLKYIIESNAYNPFTRTGTIQISGNRNIKRGMFIILEIETGSEELFYVESVSHDYSITSSGVNRVTNIGVSHGMFTNLIFPDYFNSSDPDDPKSINYSYFNLIDFGNYKKDNVDVSSWQKIISSWKVNKEVFIFFMRKFNLLSNVLPALTVKSGKNSLISSLIKVIKGN